MTSGDTTATVSTHVLDTSLGRPAAGVAVAVSARTGPEEPWRVLGGSATDADGRCQDLPAPPPGATHVRLVFDVGPYHAGARREGAAFFPEVAVAFAVEAGEHYHVPLLLNPFGYSVYRGS
ncbi:MULTISPECIES: hydroxyisourate hydrolase [Streptomyces]|uniref:5-hydroxyisourate hydrolase n=1 Tax=Streptomyces chilikensis TaxID=1194079 RepID=A0ABV3ES54_9ACTN|nr:MULTISPECIES: hydroxyisourate hydrolase [Streptomyces]MDH6223905.1 5-hydroxyisourate hydrolase [Streptomyces sp. MJP52]